MDCGPACIRMVTSAYGKDYPLSYLRTLAHLTREGVSVAGIRDALCEIGMESATFQLSLSQLEDKCPLPAILHWEQNHFVVIYKITRNKFTDKRTYHIANPAYGKHGHDLETMNKSWLNGDKGIVIALQPTEEFYAKQPVKEKHSFMRFSKKYVWPFRAQMCILALAILLGIAFSLVTPFITQHTVDDGIMRKDIGLILNLLLAQLSLFVGSFIMNLITSWVSLYMSTRININILFDYLNKLLRLPMTFFETKSVGDYNQRISDHSRLQSFVTDNTLQTVFSFFSSIVLLVIIVWFSIKIFAAYIVLTGTSIAWMAYFFRCRKALDYEQFALSASNQNKLFELMSGIVDIKLNSYEDYKVREWSSLQKKQYRMSKKALKLGQIQSIGYTAIVGESGSGKTTLMKLLLKFYAPTKGNITLNGKDLANHSAKSLREQCGIVMQDNFVFSDTIRQNIILGEPYDSRRFDEAVRMACLTEFIDRLPLHDLTKIGRDGVGISGGEKQRIMIARAIYKKPHYIMLDEATSSLDAENEHRITENMISVFHNHTMVVIAHRLSTVKNADNIVVLKQGRIVERGDHHTLVAIRGNYYNLIKNQIELAK